MKEKLAIIGTGIAGMGVAHFLHKHFDIQMYEKNNYIGGHTNTVEVLENGESIPIDTGFIVFNDVTYPNLIKLFDRLSVPVKNSKMTFSVQHKPSGLEFCGSGINGLFAQRRNFLNYKFYRLLYNINRFNTFAPKILDQPKFDSFTLGDFIKHFQYHPDLLEYYLIPMSSAVWSTPVNKMLAFPAKTLIRFFFNHGFLGLNTQHQWKTVVNGSKTYVKLITKPFQDRIHLNTGIKKIKKVSSGVVVVSDKGEEVFSKVILACHGDTALSLLDSPTDKQTNILSKFKYERNIATLHTDESLMPKKKLAWSSWNYRVERNSDGSWNDTNLIYWMNSLQGISKKQNYFVSINDPGLIRPEKVIKRIEYEHPLFDVHTQKAQEIIHSLNQETNIYFCGSYFKYGFHEDAFASAVQLSSTILGKDVWSEN